MDSLEKRSKFLSHVQDAHEYHASRTRSTVHRSAHAATSHLLLLAPRKDFEHIPQLFAALRYDTVHEPEGEDHAHYDAALSVLETAYTALAAGRALPQHTVMWERWLDRHTDWKNEEALRMAAASEHDDMVAENQTALRAAILRADSGMFADMLGLPNGRTSDARLPPGFRPPDDT